MKTRSHSFLKNIGMVFSRCPDNILDPEGGGGNGGGGAGAAGGGGQNGGAGAGGQGGAGAAGGGATGGVPEANHYPTDLEPEYHGNPHLLKFWDPTKKAFNLGKLMKSSIHAQSQMGKDKFVVPGQTATEEEWREVFTKLGLPESEDKYDIKNNLPEGMKADENLFKGFRALAHKLGVLPKQAQGMMDYYNKHVGDAISSQQAQFDAQMTKDQNALKAEWGGNYKGKVNAINQLLAEVLPTEHRQALKDSGFFANTSFIRLMDSLVTSMGKEGTFSEGGGAGEMTLDQIESEIAKMHQPGEALMNKAHPHHASARTKYDGLIRKKLAIQKFKNSAKGA